MSDAANDKRDPAQFRASAKNVNWVYATPLFLVTLPLIRQIPYLKARPVLRNRVFYGLVGVGLMHGIWLMGRKDDEVVERYAVPAGARR